MNFPSKNIKQVLIDKCLKIVRNKTTQMKKEQAIIKYYYKSLVLERFNQINTCINFTFAYFPMALMTWDK